MAVSDAPGIIFSDVEEVLRHIYHFEDVPFHVSQKQDTCGHLVELLAQVNRMVAQQADLNEMLASASGYDTGAAYQEAMERVLQAMKSPEKVAWAPEFGAALVATEVHAPVHQSIIHAVCLDTWSQQFHSEAATGVCTATAGCREACDRPIATTAPGLIAVQDLNASIHEVAKRQTKRSQTPGFYTYVAVQQATELLALAAGGFQADVSALRNVVHETADAACGGFSDVGTHTTSKPLPTCWPLAQHVLHFLAQNEAHIDTAAVVAVTHTYLASAAASAQPCNLNASMHINRRAAFAVAALDSSSQAHQALANALAAIICRTGSTLDAAVTAQQRACCARAALPPACHASAAALLQPFEVTAPSPPHHAATTVDAEARAIQNLGALPELPPAGDLEALHCWVPAMKAHGGDLEHAALIMHEVEAFFHSAALDVLHRQRRPAFPTARLQTLATVLEMYSDVVLKLETAASRSKGHAALLQVELRSREALLVWIMLCLTHRGAVAEFQATSRYALPVQPDDLRHLCLRGKAATSAALVVAAYVQKVNCAAEAGFLFSTRDDATMDFAAEFASQSTFLLEILEAERELADARRQEHWQVVQQKQAEVQVLEGKLKDAHAVLRQREQAKQHARGVLNAAIHTAQDRVSAAEQEHLRIQREARAADAVSSRGPKALAASTPRNEALAAAMATLKNAKQTLGNLKTDREGRASAAQTAEGRVYTDARKAVQLAEWDVATLSKQMKQAVEPPPRLVQPLPDITVHRRYVLALLFFLFPQYTGALSLLRQYTCAAQQCFAVPRPAGTADGHDTRQLGEWAALYNAAHTACRYGRRPQRSAVAEASSQLRLFRKLAPLERLAKQNVMKYHTPEDGVVYASAEEGGLVLMWHGGPIRRYAQDTPTDPWQPPHNVSDVSRMYTEPGEFSDWLRTPAAAGPSKLCRAAEPCGHFCCQGQTVMDGPAGADAARGNMVLTHQDVRPKEMGTEEWQAFAGLRAFPLQQMRALSLALHDGDLKLDDLHVGKAVRMVLYQLGVLEGVAGGAQALRHWSSGFDEVNVLTAEVKAQAALMLPAPKMLLKGALLGEIASHLADLSEEGCQCAREFARVAKSWAEHFRDELGKVRDNAAAHGPDFAALERELQAKCAIAHLIATTCYVNLCAGAGTKPPWAAAEATLSRDDAAAVCLHRVQADLHAFNDGDGGLYVHLRALGEQCQHAMAALIRPLDAAVALHPDVLTDAVRSVYADLPADVPWRRIPEHLGCYKAEVAGQVYSVSVLSGAALCNGMRPGHLPRTILRSKLYKRVFRERTFEVSHLQVGQQDVFRTTQSHSGCLYTFQQVGREVIVKECPVSATGAALHDLELQLLPESCDWCPELPGRLKVMHSHWLSRSRSAIVLRGTLYFDRGVHFLLAAPAAPGTGGLGRLQMLCHCVPASMRGEEAAPWHHIHDTRHTLEVLWSLRKQQQLPVMSMLARVEAPDFIHVKTKPETEKAGLFTRLLHRPSPAAIGTRTILFELPRFQMTFELQAGQATVKSQEYKGYHLASRCNGDASTTAVAREDPLPLMSFHSFLLLHPEEATMPIKLLIPDGTIHRNPCSGDVSICTDQTPGVHSLELFQYTFHAKTKNFDTQVMQYRLFLAAIFAATHIAVHIPQLGMTGGQHARQLLWQCRGNKPLSEGEAAAWKVLSGFAGHTPRLAMLCSSMLQASEALRFLHHLEPREEDAHDKDAREEGYKQAQWRYLQERREVWPRPFVNVRTELSPEELQVVFNRQRPHKQLGTVSVPASVGWKEVQDTLLAGDKNLSDLIDDVEQQTFHKQLLDLRVRYCKKTEVVLGATPDLSLDHLKTDPFGREVADDHVQSLEVFKASEASETVSMTSLPELADKLQTLLKRVKQAEVQVMQFLLRVLASSSVDLHGVVLRVYQQTGIMASPAPADLLRITLHKDFLQMLNPLLTEDARRRTVSLSLEWQALCVLESKIVRCISYTRSPHPEALAEELGNQRIWNPASQPAWLAFEVLQGIEIRQRQAIVAQHILDNPGRKGVSPDDRGAVLQLNMGEGKTRVISPMVVLAGCASGRYIELVYPTQYLLGDAIQVLHPCLTGSLLQVNLLTMPFHRDVKLDAGKVQAMASQLQFAAQTRSFVCVSRESLLSRKLKPQEIYGNHKGPTATFEKLQQLECIPSFVLFDEVDSCLAPNPPLVYAWGTHDTLPDLNHRVHIIQAMLFVLCEDSKVSAFLERKGPAVAEIQEHPGRYGGLPEIRLPGGAALEEAWPELSRELCCAVMRMKPSPGVYNSLQWLAYVPEQQREAVIQCCTNTECDPAAALSHCGPDGAEERAHLLMLRGLLAFRLLPHCLHMRHWVNFGIADRPGKKNTDMAIPFVACGTPSRRSEFKHDDVKLMLTQLAYLQRGLNRAQVQEGMHALLKAAPSQQETLHRSFIERSARDVPASEAPLLESIKKPTQIDLTHDSQTYVLFKFLRHNASFINFWLESCVFEREAKYFPESLRQTAWHLAANAQVGGFSGTTDNRSQLPLHVRAQDTTDASIRGTNGRMVHLILQPGKCTFSPLPTHGDSSVPLAQRVLDWTVAAGASALLDAGALLAGKDLYDAATYLVDNLQAASRPRSGRGMKGVVFFLEASGKPAHLRHLAAGWCMLDMQRHCIEKARSPIKEDEALVLIGDAQCRGTDMKLAPTARAVLTLGPDMCRQELMQAVARMRQIARGQTVEVIATEEVCRSIREIRGLAPEADISMANVVEWTLSNTAAAIRKEFPEFLSQGKHFAYGEGRPFFPEVEDSTLLGMYGSTSKPQSLKAFLKQAVVVDGEPATLGPEGKHCMNMLWHHAASRGHAVVATESGTAEECEREVEQQEEEVAEETDDPEIGRLEPRAETDWSDVAAVLKLHTVSDFREAQTKTKVTDFARACKCLRAEGTSAAAVALLQRLHWPKHVQLTSNFMLCAEVRTLTAPHLRKVNNLLVFPDRSVLIISEREAESVLREMRVAHPSAVRVCLVNLAMARWLCSGGLSTCESLPLAVGAKGCVQEDGGNRLALAVVAARLFNGESEYLQSEPGTEEADRARQRTVRSVLIGRRGGTALKLASASDCLVGIKALVEMRGRRLCWSGSSLEHICHNLVVQQKHLALDVLPETDE